MRVRDKKGLRKEEGLGEVTELQQLRVFLTFPIPLVFIFKKKIPLFFVFGVCFGFGSGVRATRQDKCGKNSLKFTRGYLSNTSNSGGQSCSLALGE